MLPIFKQQFQNNIQKWNKDLIRFKESLILVPSICVQEMRSYHLF